nr:hypothetical protein 6 [Gammaproteobacteria bacterium]
MPQLRKLQTDQLLYRTFHLDTRTIDDEARTVELTFSSETREVERWFGIEVLDHGPGAVKLDRLRAGGPLLFLHDMRNHLGVVEDVTIEKRKGKAVVRFGRSALAEEKFQDVKDGILVNVSVGYRVLKLVLEERGDDGLDVYRATEWEPYEISLLPVAADISIGVGRSAGEQYEIEVLEENTMPKPNETAAPEHQTRGSGNNTQQSPQVDVTAIENQAREQAREAERTRVRELRTLGSQHASRGGVELANEFIDSGRSPEDLQRALLERMQDSDDIDTGDTPDSRLDLSARDLGNYSLMRALNAAASGNWRNAGFEQECSIAISEQIGREARGFFVPLDVMVRAMTTTSAADMVPTEHMGEMFIEALRPMSVVMRLGATVMDGLEGDVSMPKELSTPTFGWIGDDDDGDESDVDIGGIKMIPHILSGGVPMSRSLLRQSSPSVENVIRRSLLRGAALGLDMAALAGTGTNNQPRGVANLTGINTQTVASAGDPTWAEVVGFETKVASDNALEGNLAYVTTSGVAGNMKIKAKDAGSGRFVLEDKQANGHEVAVSNQLAANTILFGNWADVFIGLWGVTDIMPDTATKVKSGGLVLRVFHDADVAAGHAQSFCKNA